MTTGAPDPAEAAPLFPAFYTVLNRSGHIVETGCRSWPTQIEAIAFLRGMFGGAGMSRSADRSATGRIEFWPEQTREHSTVLHEITSPLRIGSAARLVDSWRPATTAQEPGPHSKSP